MNMSISGAGKIPAGEFDHVKISGSGRCMGTIKCIGFHAAGAAHCDGDVICAEEFHVSGASHVNGSVTAQEIHGSGSLHVDGNCTAHKNLRARGAITVEGEIASEDADIRGAVKCGGLLNAETLYMELENRCRIHSIGGSNIEIKVRRDAKNVFSFFGRKKNASSLPTVLEVSEAIEGDNISLEGVRVPSVVGRSVVIGSGCSIGVVRYSESIEIAQDAVVKNHEKI